MSYQISEIVEGKITLTLDETTNEKQIQEAFEKIKEQAGTSKPTLVIAGSFRLYTPFKKYLESKVNEYESLFIRVTNADGLKVEKNFKKPDVKLLINEIDKVKKEDILLEFFRRNVNNENNNFVFIDHEPLEKEIKRIRNDIYFFKKDMQWHCLFSPEQKLNEAFCIPKKIQEKLEGLVANVPVESTKFLTGKYKINELLLNTTISSMSDDLASDVTDATKLFSNVEQYYFSIQNYIHNKKREEKKLNTFEGIEVGRDDILTEMCDDLSSDNVKVDDLLSLALIEKLISPYSSVTGIVDVKTALMTIFQEKIRPQSLELTALLDTIVSQTTIKWDEILKSDATLESADVFKSFLDQIHQMQKAEQTYLRSDLSEDKAKLYTNQYQDCTQKINDMLLTLFGKLENIPSPISSQLNKVTGRVHLVKQAVNDSKTDLVSYNFLRPEIRNEQKSAIEGLSSKICKLKAFLSKSNSADLHDIEQALLDEDKLKKEVTPYLIKQLKKNRPDLTETINTLEKLAKEQLRLFSEFYDTYQEKFTALLTETGAENALNLVSQLNKDKSPLSEIYDVSLELEKILSEMAKKSWDPSKVGFIRVITTKLELLLGDCQSLLSDRLKERQASLVVKFQIESLQHKKAALNSKHITTALKNQTPTEVKVANIDLSVIPTLTNGLIKEAKHINTAHQAYMKIFDAVIWKCKITENITPQIFDIIVFEAMGLMAQKNEFTQIKTDGNFDTKEFKKLVDETVKTIEEYSVLYKKCLDATNSIYKKDINVQIGTLHAVTLGKKFEWSESEFVEKFKILWDDFKKYNALCKNSGELLNWRHRDQFDLIVIRVIYGQLLEGKYNHDEAVEKIKTHFEQLDNIKTIEDIKTYQPPLLSNSPMTIFSQTQRGLFQRLLDDNYLNYLLQKQQSDPSYLGAYDYYTQYADYLISKNVSNPIHHLQLSSLNIQGIPNLMFDVGSLHQDVVNQLFVEMGFNADKAVFATGFRLDKSKVSTKLDSQGNIIYQLIGDTEPPVNCHIAANIKFEFKLVKGQDKFFTIELLSYEIQPKNSLTKQFLELPFKIKKFKDSLPVNKETKQALLVLQLMRTQEKINLRNALSVQVISTLGPKGKEKIKQLTCADAYDLVKAYQEFVGQDAKRINIIDSALKEAEGELFNTSSNIIINVRGMMKDNILSLIEKKIDTDTDLKRQFIGELTAAKNYLVVLQDKSKDESSLVEKVKAALLQQQQELVFELDKKLISIKEDDDPSMKFSIIIKLYNARNEYISLLQEKQNELLQSRKEVVECNRISIELLQQQSALVRDIKFASTMDSKSLSAGEETEMNKLILLLNQQKVAYLEYLFEILPGYIKSEYPINEERYYVDEFVEYANDVIVDYETKIGKENRSTDYQQKLLNFRVKLSAVIEELSHRLSNQIETKKETVIPLKESLSRIKAEQLPLKDSLKREINKDCDFYGYESYSNEEMESFQRNKDGKWSHKNGASFPAAIERDLNRFEENKLQIEKNSAALTQTQEIIKIKEIERDKIETLRKPLSLDIAKGVIRDLKTRPFSLPTELHWGRINSGEKSFAETDMSSLLTALRQDVFGSADLEKINNPFSYVYFAGKAIKFSLLYGNANNNLSFLNPIVELAFVLPLTLVNLGRTVYHYTIASPMAYAYKQLEAAETIGQQVLWGSLAGVTTATGYLLSLLTPLGPLFGFPTLLTPLTYVSKKVYNTVYPEISIKPIEVPVDSKKLIIEKKKIDKTKIQPTCDYEKLLAPETNFNALPINYLKEQLIKVTSDNETLLSLVGKNDEALELYAKLKEMPTKISTILKEDELTQKCSTMNRESEQYKNTFKELVSLWIEAPQLLNKFSNPDSMVVKLEKNLDNVVAQVKQQNEILETSKKEAASSNSRYSYFQSLKSKFKEEQVDTQNIDEFVNRHATDEIKIN